MSPRRRAPPPTPSPDEVVDLLDALAHAGGLDVPPDLPFRSIRFDEPTGRLVHLDEVSALAPGRERVLELERLEACLDAIAVAAAARWGPPLVHDRDLRRPLDREAPTFAEERRDLGFSRLRGWRRGLPERVLWVGVEQHGAGVPHLVAGVTVWPGLLRAEAPTLARQARAKTKAPARKRRAR